MNEYRVAVAEGHALDEVCARAEGAGFEILARFACFDVFLASGPSAAALRKVEGVKAVEVTQEVEALAEAEPA